MWHSVSVAKVGVSGKLTLQSLADPHCPYQSMQTCRTPYDTCLPSAAVLTRPDLQDPVWHIVLKSTVLQASGFDFAAICFNGSVSGHERKRLSSSGYADEVTGVAIKAEHALNRSQDIQGVVNVADIVFHVDLHCTSQVSGASV